MGIRRILGILILLAGLFGIGFSSYINNQVAQGQEQIASAQKKVDTGSKLSSLNPITKEIGKGVTGAVQEKIDEGQQEVDYYADMAQKLKISGIALSIGGLVLLLIPRKKKS